MTSPSPDWVAHGRGSKPQIRWSLVTDAPLVAAHWIAETGDVVAADDSGGLYRVNRLGQILGLTRGFSGLRSFAWSATGAAGVCSIGDDRVRGIGPDLRQQWELHFPASVTALAISPYANWLAVSLMDRTTLLLDAAQRVVTHLETAQSLQFLAFASATPVLLGAAEYGFICGYDLDNEGFWERNVPSPIGDLCASVGGETVFVAAYAQGVPLFDRYGEKRGRILVEGTPYRVCASFDAGRLAVGTLERHLYWVDAEGRLIWGTAVPEELTSLSCDPSGRSLLCCFTSGRLVCIGWEDLPSAA